MKYYCNLCGFSINSGDSQCRECGKLLKWEVKDYIFRKVYTPKSNLVTDRNEAWELRQAWDLKIRDNFRRKHKFIPSLGKIDFIKYKWRRLWGTNDKRRRAFKNDEIIAIANKYGGRCQGCGREEDLEIDHILPISRGGGNQIDNLTLLCRHCNSSKGNRYTG